MNVSNINIFSVNSLIIGVIVTLMSAFLTPTNAKTAFDNCAFNKGLPERDYLISDLQIFNSSNKTNSNAPINMNKINVKLKINRKYALGTFWSEGEARNVFSFNFVFPDGSPSNEKFYISSSIKRNEQYYNEVRGLFHGGTDWNLSRLMSVYRPNSFDYFSDKLLYRISSRNEFGFDVIVFQKIINDELVDVQDNKSLPKREPTTYFYSNDESGEIFAYCTGNDPGTQSACKLYSRYNGTYYDIFFFKHLFYAAKTINVMTRQLIDCSLSENGK